MIGYYDLILGLIPTALIGLTALLYASGFDLTAAVPLAGLVSAGLIGHAMFVNAPVDDIPAARTDGPQITTAD